MRLTLLLMLLSLSVSNVTSQPFRLMTYNVRYDNPEDGDNRWSLRRNGLIGLIKKSDPDVVGMQEVLASQLSDITKELKGYECFGVGRDDGAQVGEYAPLLVRSKRFSVQSNGWFWLSETPDQPGKGWDAACNRICTWVLAKDKLTKRNMLIMNTHLDHVGVVARGKSVEQLIYFIREKSDLQLEEAKKEEQAGLAIVLMGDFNFTPSDPAYRSLKESIRLLNEPLTDAHEATATPVSGSEATFNGFDLDQAPADRIDYIWTSGLEVRSYRCMEDKLENGRWPSDHLPVIIEVDAIE